MDVIIESWHLVPVLVQEPEGIVVAKVLKLHQKVGLPGLECVHHLVHEAVKISPCFIWREVDDGSSSSNDDTSQHMGMVAKKAVTLSAWHQPAATRAVSAATRHSLP